MTPCLRVRVSVVLLAMVTVSCSDAEVDPPWDGDTAAALRSAPGDLGATAPEGYTLAFNGTHPDGCVPSATDPTRWICPTIIAPTPAPAACGGFGIPTETYSLYQRGVDWNGIGDEVELHGETYAIASRGAVAYNQTVIIQCCPADPRRAFVTEAFFAIKTCPDPCGPADAMCKSTCGESKFGGCWPCADPIRTERCDIRLVEAGWRDPHAPHDLDDPSGGDKAVWDVYFRIAWTCGDGFCDTDETCATCDDCCAP